MGTPANRTPLHGRHAAAGARFADFAGWEMPIRYSEVREEHLAVRGDVGCFDVSHMGQIHVGGDGARALLAEALTNNLARASTGEAQYTLMCGDDGGVIDDLILYALEDGYLLVVNAGNLGACLDRLRALAPRSAAVVDRSPETGMLAVQGPNWRRALAPLLADDTVTRLDPFRWARAPLAGRRALVARTGYTGEPGVEIMCGAEDLVAVWDALMAGPNPPRPAGLGARDTLRLEMGYPLYGHELDLRRTPVEAGLAWACDLAGGTFRGADVLRGQRDHGTDERLVCFVMTATGIPRAGCAVVADGAAVGVVTSGTLSPSLDTGVGMAYVRAERAAPGTEVGIEIRGAVRAAEVRRRPLVETSPREQ